MKRPRVTFITKSLLIGYGVDEIVNFLAEQLSRKGYDIRILAAKNEYPSHGYKTIAYKVKAIPFMNEYWNSNFLIDLRSFISIGGALKKSDIIVTVDPMHIIGALGRVFFRKKVLMYFFGVPPLNVLDNISRKVESIRQTLTWNLSFLFSNHLLTNSLYTRNRLTSTTKERAVVNYHGVDHLIACDSETTSKLRQELEIGDRKLILSVGRFSTPYKGMVEMLGLFRLQPPHDSVLLLVGRGSKFDLGLKNPPENVKVLSNVSTKTLKTCLGACDIYCTCSKWEGFDLPLVAAEANGKPVVAYNVGAHSEVVAHGESGFLAENPGELCGYLNRLVEDATLRKKMGDNAKRAARKFIWETSVRVFQEILLTMSQE